MLSLRHNDIILSRQHISTNWADQVARFVSSRRASQCKSTTMYWSGSRIAPAWTANNGLRKLRPLLAAQTSNGWKLITVLKSFFVVARSLGLYIISLHCVQNERDADAANALSICSLALFKF